MKRTLSEDANKDTIKNTKLCCQKVESDPSSSSSTDKIDKYPIENGLYLTKIEGLDTSSFSQTFTLSELIDRINPITSIHFNFCIDPDFLIRYFKT